MADKTSSPTDTREQAMQMRAVWSNIGSDVQYGDLSLPELEERIAALDAAARNLGILEDQMVIARNEFWEKRRALWEQIKRVKLGVRIKHGEESEQYERFGGTRPSRRRRPARITNRSESQASQ